ncbi:MAG: protein translocase subunit SecF [Acidiferrobacteraceae bacterium]
MEFFHIKQDIPFMRYARVTTIISALTFMAAVWMLATRGLNLGVDFTGGTVMEVVYPGAARLGEVRTLLARSGFNDTTVQNLGTSSDVLIRLPAKMGLTSAQVGDRAYAALRAQAPGLQLRRVDYIGPEVGKELFNDGALALLLVSAGITIYLAFRFEWRFAIGAIVATVHDVVILLGLFSFFRWDFSLTVLAAVLAILGYSVNDTVVVFDRIRENFRKLRKGTIPQVIDNAITRTLSRTVMTHVMTQLMVLSMLFLGGRVLFYFALALTIGIVVGTYSSVLVASPIVMWLGISRDDLLPSRKETAQYDARP